MKDTGVAAAGRYKHNLTFAQFIKSLGVVPFASFLYFIFLALAWRKASD